MEGPIPDSLLEVRCPVRLSRSATPWPLTIPALYRRRNFLDSSTYTDVIAWDVTGEYVIIYHEEALRGLLLKTATSQTGREVKHKMFYYQMNVSALRICPALTIVCSVMSRWCSHHLAVPNWTDLGLVPRAWRRPVQAAGPGGCESLEA